jgi:hypothetical protein
MTRREQASAAGTMAGARVDDDEGRLGQIYRGPRRRYDAHEGVVDRAWELAASEKRLEVETENVARRLLQLLETLVPALGQHVEGQDRSMPSVDPAFLHSIELLVCDMVILCSRNAA